MAGAAVRDAGVAHAVAVPVELSILPEAPTDEEPSVIVEFKTILATFSTPFSVNVVPSQINNELPAIVFVPEPTATCVFAMLPPITPVMSAATKLRNVGGALEPEVGPAHTVLAACAPRVNVNAGVFVGFVTEAVAMPPILAALNVVTLPTPYSCAFTKAVVANSVLLSAVAGVGAVGVPVNAGDANGAAPVI